MSTVPLDDLKLPQGLVKSGTDSITTWCDTSIPIIKVIHTNIRLEDREINGKKISNLNLYIDDEDIIKKSTYPKF